MNQITEHPGPDAINAYVDGELSTDEAQGAREHMENCHYCALLALSAMQLKAATARAGHCFTPPAEALTRLTARLHAEPGPVARIHPFRPIAWGLLAAAAVLVVSFLGWNQVRHSNTLAAELLDQHLAVLSADAAPQVISSDRHTVKPWFQGKIPFAFDLPELENSEFSLLGGRMTYLDQTPGAHLIYEVGSIGSPCSYSGNGPCGAGWSRTLP